jgi:hypothetical protein
LSGSFGQKSDEHSYSGSLPSGAILLGFVWPNLRHLGRVRFAKMTAARCLNPKLAVISSQPLLRMRKQISGERRYASCKNNWNDLSPDGSAEHPGGTIDREGRDYRFEAFAAGASEE